MKLSTLLSISTNNGNRLPKMSMPMSKLELFGQFLSVMGLVYAFVTFFTMFDTLPDRIPIHFDFSGNINGWGTKSGLIALPFVGLGIFILFTVLERFPQTYNISVKVTEENAPRLYILARASMVFLKALLIWMFGGLFYFSCQAGLTGDISNMFLFIMLMVGGMIALMAGFFIAMARNK